MDGTVNGQQGQQASTRGWTSRTWEARIDEVWDAFVHGEITPEERSIALRQARGLPSREGSARSEHARRKAEARR